MPKGNLPENRLVTNPKKQNNMERSPAKSGLVQANSGKINRGTGVPGQGDGGPSKGKKVR